MANAGARVGPHVNRWYGAGLRGIAPHVDAARAEARAAGVEIGAVAFFPSGPRNLRANDGFRSPAELAATRAYLGASGLAVLAHAAYVAQPWSTGARGAAAVRHEAELCEAAGIGLLAVHLPRDGGEESRRTVWRVFPDLLTRAMRAPGGARTGGGGGGTGGEAAGTRLALEIEADRPVGGRPPPLATPEGLAELFAGLPQGGAAPWVVVDTAHLASSGACLRTYAEADDWLRRAEHVAPLGGRIAFHLNDLDAACGSGIDRHAPLFRGSIWRGVPPLESGAAAVLDCAARLGAPVILERHSRAELALDYAALAALLPPAQAAADVRAEPRA
jgi:endonuclease IV